MGMNDFFYSDGTGRRAGPRRCMIMDARRTVSKSSGTPMLTVTLRPSDTVASVRKHFVDGPYFDDNVSRFMDAFPDIDKEDGVTFPERWRGAIGAVRLILNDDGFFQVADRGGFIPADSELARDLPEFIWQHRRDEDPEMPVFGRFAEMEEDTSLLPF